MTTYPNPLKTVRRIQQSLKALVPVLMMAVFLYNIFGYFVVFRVNRSLVRAEMKRRIAGNERKILVMNIVNAEKDPDFRRIDSKEFRYNGQMFDVVREVKQGSTTTFYCIRDTKEEILMAGMRKAAKTKSTQHLVHHLITMAMPVPSCLAQIPYFRHFLFPPLELPLLQRPADPLAPPPERG